MRPVYVTGVGMTAFGHHWKVSLEVLGARAVSEAVADAEMQRHEIESVYVGHMSQGELVGQRILREMEFPEVPVLNVENACASGASALREAWIAVGAGVVDTALVLGIEKLAHKGLLNFQNPTLEQQMGFIIPGSYAIAGQRHMAEYGTTAEQFAWISVKNHANGALNPLAMFRNQCRLDEVLASRVIAEPLTLLQCCASASGAAVAILSCASIARRRKTPRPIRLLVSSLASRINRGTAEDLTVFEATARAAKVVYEWAGIGPEDVDVVELHDAFTVGELLHYEGLELCTRGEGGRLVDERATELGGRIPVNPSGGLLSRGHPVGATGVAQIVELVSQLRERSGPRQVDGARTGLAQCQGGVGPGTGAAVVTMLSR